MKLYRVVYKDLLLFLGQENECCLISPSSHLFDLKDIFTLSATSQHNNGTYKVGGSVFLELPQTQFPKIAESFKQELINQRNKMVVYSTTLINDVLNYSPSSRGVLHDTITLSREQLLSFFASHRHQSYHHLSIQNVNAVIDMFIGLYLTYNDSLAIYEIFNLFSERLSEFFDATLIDAELNIRTSFLMSGPVFRQSVLVPIERHSNPFTVIRYKDKYYVRIGMKHIGSRIILANHMFFHNPFQTAPF